MKSKARTFVVWAGTLLVLASSGGGQPPPLRVVDRIVAMVDEVPILLSDVERALALDLARGEPPVPEADRRRRALDGLIDQHLRWREVERFAGGGGRPVEVEDQLAAIRGRFASSDAFDAHLASLGLDAATLRQLLGRQWRILAYVEERLGPRVIVEPEAVERYYVETLVPALEKAGTVVPPLDEVFDDIRRVLWQQGLNAEIETWTDGLRADADVVDLLDPAPTTRPPVRRRLEAPVPPPR